MKYGFLFMDLKKNTMNFIKRRHVLWYFVPLILRLMFRTYIKTSDLKRKKRNFLYFVCKLSLRVNFVSRLNSKADIVSSSVTCCNQLREFYGLMLNRLRMQGWHFPLSFHSVEKWNLYCYRKISLKWYFMCRQVIYI